MAHPEPARGPRRLADRAAPLSVFALACLLAGYAGALGEEPVRDDEAVVELVRAEFDAAGPRRRLTVLPRLGWPHVDPANLGRLAGETAAHVRALLGGDPAAVVRALVG
ncbi:hypothetical protein [Actinoplanes teichomyceticus]|uniref:Uncharacterized protein n=1 Tax=Actinoplanes teichomyceticus TaxID=1867 RepID=A0A561WID8_ACTTI|nr:hypothetical protein [Actinoplanes teichomyceticus]TWG23623.1 hypothetical protein FHX34_102172 [Actinoplanes teichomyceticus]GIF11662.1 hypothetical protein Ate01nite_16940 [Actinoplanes teichomyceticus]